MTAFDIVNLSMTAEDQPKGTITRIYPNSSDPHSGLLARGLDATGNGFSARPLSLDEHLQPIVILDDGTEVGLADSTPSDKVEDAPPDTL
jgi:hypothetical protein